jgi:raffinose/stachyose/melibiose transport system permease protein
VEQRKLIVPTVTSRVRSRGIASAPDAVSGSGDSRPPDRTVRAGRARVLRQQGVPWWWLVPALAAVLVFQFLPVIAGAFYSFTSWNGIGPAKYVGLQNFRDIFSDYQARGALEHTLELSAAFVVVSNIVGLGLAVGLHRTVKSRHILRAVFFAPVILTPLATSYIWAYIFQYDGPLNQLLGAVGLSSWQQTWLASPTWALWTILVVMVWQSSGIAMVIYLAGLQGIPDTVYEAAALDGASPTRRFWAVTVPLLAPTITVNLVLSMIFGLRAFDQILALTNGGPYGASQTLATEVWQETFVNGRYGYGSALAVLLTLLIAILATIQFILLRRREKAIQG